MIRKTLTLSLACLTAPMAAAHPHVFVDTELRLLLNDRQEVTGIEVRWRYDDLYSMLLFEDMGLDGDFDGRLNPAELTQLQAFDLNWMPGFEGDLFVTTSDGPVPLSPPEPLATRVEDARIVSAHLRPLAQPVPAAAVTVRAYDPTFYTAYTLTDVSVAGDCRPLIEAADLNEAYDRLEELLFALPEGDAAQEEFPQVGSEFADTVTVRCPA